MSSHQGTTTPGKPPNIKLSKKIAKQFFQEYHLPRRVRDREKEEIQLERKDKRKAYYRRVLANEEDRGELYPVWKAGYHTFADFGIGIGIYFTQLLVLAGVSLVAGAILALGSREYAEGYGINESSDLLMSVTAACPAPQNITVSQGCAAGQTNCTALYLPNCNLPANVIIADLTMSLIFAFAIFASKLLENQIVEKLDLTLQTISDYSVEVLDPDRDADNPDEWYEFFSRFGSVRYISIIRKNEKIVYNCFLKHKLLHRIRVLESQLAAIPLVPSTVNHTLGGAKQENLQLQQYSAQQQKLLKKIRRYESKLDRIELNLSKLYNKNYRVCRVFVTFENEEEQRLCLQALEVPDIEAILDIKDLSNMKNLFRGQNVLNVIEPVEPDNVLWQHVAYENSNKQWIRTIVSYALTVLTFTAVWYVIVAAEGLNDSLKLGVVIAVFDSFLPVIFESFTNITLPSSESRRQGDLQLRLFLARLFLSTLVPYLQTNWNQTLSRSFIEQIIIVQVSASFVTPLIALLDIGNVVRRNLTAYYQSDTQEELNLKWSGSEWSLAEKYTGISKVLFVSLYYAILVPYSILIAMFAFLWMFFIDRYLLLRKWKVAPMLDESVAVRLRQQAILAVAAHMYVTIRFIYSWPMDEVYHHKDSQIYEKVDKYPSWNVFQYQSQPWQNDAQREYLLYYYIGMILVFLLTLYVWIIVPLGSYLYRLFCYNLKVIGESQQIPFSQIHHNMTVYEPVYPYRETKFLCSHLIEVKEEHRPAFITAYDQDNHDIVDYIPEVHRPHILSVVKYYSKEEEEMALQQQQGSTSNYNNSSSNKNDLLGKIDVSLALVTSVDSEEEENSEAEEGKSQEKGKNRSSRNSNKNPNDPKRISANQSNLRSSLTAADRTTYHALPLHVALDSRQIPKQRKAGVIPEELRQKIASKEVTPSPSSSNARRSLNRFPNRPLREETEQDDIESGRGFGTNLFRSSTTKIAPQFSDSPPKENYRQRRRFEQD